MLFYGAQPLKDTQTDFNIKKANQQFDKINLQLSVQNLNLSHLNNAVKTLTKLSAQADNCVDQVQKKLNNIDILLKQVNNTEENKKGADLVYLSKQQNDLAQKTSTM